MIECTIPSDSQWNKWTALFIAALMNWLLETTLKNTFHSKSDESSADVISPSSADKLGESTDGSGSLSKPDRPLFTRVVEGEKKKGTQDSTIS